MQRTLRGDLDNIVLKCLRPEPHRRYPNAGALADDLERHLRSKPVTAAPDTISYRAGRFFRKNKSQLRHSAFALAILLLVAVVAFVVRNIFFPPPEIHFEFEQPMALYIESGRRAVFTGEYHLSGVKISGLKLRCTVFSGPNKSFAKMVTTDNNGRFTFAYNGLGGTGTDSVRFENVVDEPGEVKFADARVVHWTPKGTLFGPLGPAIGELTKDGKHFGGITCEGERFGKTPIKAHGIVRVRRVHADSLSIAVVLENGDPNLSYEIEVFEAGEGCASSTLAATGVILQADKNGNGSAQLSLPLPHATPKHHVLGR